MKKAFILLAFPILLSACLDSVQFGGRRLSFSLDSQNIGDHLGYIRYEGERAADGCEWLMTVGEETYHLETKNALWLQSEQYVLVDYTITPDEFQCGLNPDNVFETLTIDTEAGNYTTLYYVETQCSNPWNPTLDDTALAVAEWLVAQELAPYTLQLHTVEGDFGTCASCDCPTMRYVQVQVANGDTADFLELGFVDALPEGWDE